jgi:NAD(P)H-dependent FMN reductase
MNIAVIQGSPRSDSNSEKVANFLCDQLNQREGITVTLIDLRTYNFPNFTLDEAPEYLEEFRAQLTQADGLLFTFPEYNGRVPGAMKNALDFYRAEYDKKPMAACTVSAGPFGGVNAWHDFQSWMLYVGGIVCPNNLKVSHVGSLFNEEGQPTEAHFLKNYSLFLDDFLWLARKIKD